MVIENERKVGAYWTLNQLPGLNVGDKWFLWMTWYVTPRARLHGGRLSKKISFPNGSSFRCSCGVPKQGASETVRGKVARIWIERTHAWVRRLVHVAAHSPPRFRGSRASYSRVVGVPIKSPAEPIFFIFSSFFVFFFLILRVTRGIRNEHSSILREVFLTKLPFSLAIMPLSFR